MALPSSGPLSIDDIRTELGSSSGSLRTLSAAAGKSTPDAISEFYGYSSFTPSGNFNVITYSGNTATTRAITGLSFKPDLVWIKNRDTHLGDWAVFDSVRGATERLWLGANGASGNSDYPQDTDSNSLTSFNSNGFTVSSNDNDWNSNSYDFVAFCWKGANSNSTNTTGSISSTVSANSAAGFSIVKYTGNGSSSATVGHGLGATPKWVIIKRIEPQFEYEEWKMYSSSIGTSKALEFNEPSGPISSAAYFPTTPTSSVFTPGYDAGVNQSTKQYVAYCFADITGYQKMGIYSGGSTGSGNQITTGFTPKFLIVKRNGSFDPWCVFDTVRDSSPTNTFLETDTNEGETTLSGSGSMVTTSTGFYWNGTNDETNDAGEQYVYLAIA